MKELETTVFLPKKHIFDNFKYVRLQLGRSHIHDGLCLSLSMRKNGYQIPTKEDKKELLKVFKRLLDDQSDMTISVCDGGKSGA